MDALGLVRFPRPAGRALPLNQSSTDRIRQFVALVG